MADLDGHAAAETKDDDPFLLRPITMSAGQGETEIYDRSAQTKPKERRKCCLCLHGPVSQTKQTRPESILVHIEDDRSLRRTQIDTLASRKRQTEKSDRPTHGACNEQQATQDDDNGQLEYDELLQTFLCR